MVRFLSGILDQSLVLIPPPWRPEALFGRYIPGLGIILSLLLLLVTGILVKNLFGRQIVMHVDDLDHVTAQNREMAIVQRLHRGAPSLARPQCSERWAENQRRRGLRRPQPSRLLAAKGSLRPMPIAARACSASEDVTG